MQSIKIPPQLESLKLEEPGQGSCDISTKISNPMNIETSLTYPQRSQSELFRRHDSIELPKKLHNLSEEALNYGLAMRYIPVHFSTNEKIFQAADQVDHVVDAITDERTDVVDGAGFTEIYSDVQEKRKEWVSCEIIRKIEQNKFLVFIEEQELEKIVSTENLIFQNVILLTDNKREIIDISKLIEPYFSVEVAKDEFIEVFNQEKLNYHMRKRFNDTVEEFTQQSFNYTEKEFELSDNLAEYAVNNMTLTHLNELELPEEATNSQKREFIDKSVRERENQAFHVEVVKEQSGEYQPSRAVELCELAVDSIDFNGINREIQIYSFNENKEKIVNLFIREAELIDSEILLLKRAISDENNEFHWCSQFLGLFIWSKYKIFESRNIFQYCFDIEEPNEDNFYLFELHRQEFERNEVIVSKHLENIYSKTFITLRHYITNVFEQHCKQIMACASDFIELIWTDKLPEIAPQVSESFIEHFSYRGINEFFIQIATKDKDLKKLSFYESFSEKLINTHKVVYEIMTPHIIDQIMSDFALEVLEHLNDKLHSYQSSHGKIPLLKERDSFANEAYLQTHDKYIQIFKIMQITFLKLFTDELYEYSIPEWFYFLLALVHGGKRKLEEEDNHLSDIARFLYTQPNDESFFASLEKDIDSLNKFTDFRIPFDKEQAESVLDSLREIEFNLNPLVDENFVTNVRFIPDPLEMAEDLEKSIENLHIYYSCSPKFDDIIIFDNKTAQVKNKLTLTEKELLIDKSELSYPKYLELAYSEEDLHGCSEGNPFGLAFLAPDGRGKQQKSEKFIELKNNKFNLKEEEEFEFDVKIETKMAESIYYEPSILLQKLVRLSKVASEKLFKYFDQLEKYFKVYIDNSLQLKSRIFETENLLPLNGEVYEKLLKSVAQNTKMLKIEGSNEEQIILRMKPISEFLRNDQLSQLISDEYKCGAEPPEFVSKLLANQIARTVESLKLLYKNAFDILALPQTCYYSTCKINFSSLVTTLENQNKVMFDSYGLRLEDYICLALRVMEDCLLKVDEKLQQNSFSSTQEIGEIYEICKLLVFNKQKWLDTYNKIDAVVGEYEGMPFGSSMIAHYNATIKQFYGNKLLFKKVFDSNNAVVEKIGTAYQQAFSFIQSVQFSFDSIVSDVLQRVQEYFSISYDDWLNCSKKPMQFKNKYPLLTSSFDFPKPLRVDDYSLIDTKRLIKEIESISFLPLFKANHVKIHVFERFQQFKPENLNDAFQELDELILKCIDTLQFLQALKTQLLGNTELDFFDAIDKLLFVTPQKKAFYLSTLRNQGENVELSPATMPGIVSPVIHNGNTLNKLQNLQPVFKIAFQLINICSNLPQNYAMWLQQSLSGLQTDEIKRQLIGAINICTVIQQKFAQDFAINSFCVSLLRFLQVNTNNFKLIFFIKAAVYENTISTYDKEQREIIQRSKYDREIRIDENDFVVQAQLINIIIQSINLKISDDVTASELVTSLEPFIQQILLYSERCAQRIRYDKLLELQEQELNRILMAEDDFSTIDGQFEVIGAQVKPSISLDESASGGVGPDWEMVRKEYSCKYCKEYAKERFFANNVLNLETSHFFENASKNPLIENLKNNKSFVISARQEGAISAFHSQMLLNESDSLLQMAELHWHIYIFIEQIALFQANQPLEQVNIYFSKLNQEENDKFGAIIKQFRQLLTGCYSTASNAFELSFRRFVKEKLWEYCFELQNMLCKNLNVCFPYYYPKGNDFIRSVFSELLWSDLYFSPILEKSHKIFNGALIYLIPDEINNSLMSMLSSLGIECAGFNIIYFISKESSGKTYGYYYIDGLTFVENIYFKFVYPLIFDSLADVYENLTIAVLSEVVLMTLEFHMLYWKEEFQEDQALKLRSIIMFYPQALSFYIIGHLVESEINNILSFGETKESSVAKLEDYLNELSNIYNNECDIYDCTPDIDLTELEEYSAQSMFISLENYFYYNPKSEFDYYLPAKEFRFGLYSKNNVAQKATTSEATIKEVTKELTMADEIVNDESDLETDSFEYSIDGEDGVLASNGWSASSFSKLAMEEQNNIFTQENIMVVYYYQQLLQQFLSNVESNSYYADICTTYCDGDLVEFNEAISKYIHDLGKELGKGERIQNSITFPSHLKVFCQGSLQECHYGRLASYCSSSSQLLLISFMVLGQLIPKFVVRCENNSAFICVTPNIDMLNIPTLFCIFQDYISLILQRKVIHIHVLSTVEVDLLKKFIENDDIILVTGIEMCTPEIFEWFLELLRYSQEINKGAMVMILPGLYINDILECSVEENVDKIIGQLNIPYDNMFLLAELYYNCKEEEYEELVYDLSECPPEMELPQEVIEIIFKNENIPILDKINKLGYILSYRNKFNEEIIKSLSALLLQVFPDENVADLEYTGLTKTMTEGDEFLYSLFDADSQYEFGQKANENNGQTAINGIPVELTSLVYLPKQFIEEQFLNTIGWKYIADVILLIFKANLESIGLNIQVLPLDIIRYLADCIFQISNKYIEFSTKIINATADFEFDYDNSLSILENCLYIIIIKHDDDANNSVYKETIIRFLSLAKPLSTFTIVLSDDKEILLYCQYYTMLEEAIINSRSLIKQIVFTSKFSQVFESDYEILQEKNLTPTEFNYIISKFSIPLEKRQIEIVLQNNYLRLQVDIFDMICQGFAISDIEQTRSFIILIYELLEIYGIIRIQEHSNHETILLGDYFVYISDSFLAQLAFSSKNVSSCLSKFCLLMFLFSFAAAQIIIITEKGSKKMTIEKLLEDCYEECYANLLLHKSSQYKYTQVVEEYLKSIEGFDIAQYTDIISNVLPLPLSQEQSTKMISFKDIYKVYLPEFECMTDCQFDDISEFKDELYLFGKGFHTKELLIEISTRQVSLPVNNSIHRDLQIKSDLFLTDSYSKDSKIKSLFKLFDRVFLATDSQENLLIFNLCAHLYFQRTVVAFSHNSMECTELIVNNAILCLERLCYSYQNTMQLYQDRKFYELKLLQYNIDSQDDIFSSIEQFRELLTLEKSKAIFNIFTIIEYTIGKDLLLNVYVKNLRSKYIEIPNEIGESQEYKLINCAILFITKSDIELSSVIKEMRPLVLCCDYANYDKGNYNSNELVSIAKEEFLELSVEQEEFCNSFQELKLAPDFLTISQELEEYFEEYYTNIEKLELPFYKNIMQTELFEYKHGTITNELLGESLNIGLFETYYNRLLFGCIEDSARAEYKENYEDNYDRFKNDPSSLYDYNEDIVQEAVNFKYFIEIAGQPITLMTIPAHYIFYEPILSYAEVVEQLSITLNALPDFPSEQQSYKSRNMLIDVFSACSSENYLRLNYPLNFEEESTRSKVISVIRLAMNLVFGIQKGEPYPCKSEEAEQETSVSAPTEAPDRQSVYHPVIEPTKEPSFQSSSCKYIETQNNETFNVLKPIQCENYDSIKLLITKKEQYDIIYMVFPLTILLQTNTLNLILDLLAPGNENSMLYSIEEFVEVCSEIQIFTKLDHITQETIEMILCQRIEFIIVQDLNLNIIEFPNYFNYVNIFITEKQKIEHDYFGMNMKQLISLNYECTDKFIEEFENTFTNIGLDDIFEGNNLKILWLCKQIFEGFQACYLGKYGFSICYELACSLEEELCKMYEQRKSSYQDLERQIRKIQHITELEKDDVTKQEIMLLNEEKILKSLIDLEQSLTLSNGDLESELNKVVRELTIETQHEQVLQNKIEKLEKEQMSLMQQSNIELEQISKSEIIELFNEKQLNNTMIFVLQVIWYVIGDKLFANVKDLQLPNDSDAKALWKEIRTEMFAQISIPSTLEEYDYKNIPPEKIELVHDFCKLEIFDDEMMPFAETRLQRKIINYIFAINNYFNNSIDQKEIEELEDLKKSNELIDEKRQYLKEEQQTSKIKLAHNQKQIDECQGKVDELREMLKQENGVLNCSSTIMEFFLEVQNDVMYDIGECDANINVASYSAVLLSYSLFYGYDVIQEINQLLLPTKEAKCIVCQQFNSPVCQYCEECKCQCVCLFDVDEDGQETRSPKKYPSYSLNFNMKSKESIFSILHKLYWHMLSRKLISDYYIGLHDNDKFELLSLIAFSESGTNKCLAVSEKNYMKVVQICEEIESIPEMQIIDLDNDIQLAAKHIEEYATKDTVTFVILLTKKYDIQIIQLMADIVEYNKLVSLRQQCNAEFLNERIKISPRFKTLRAYMVFDRNVYEQYYNEYNLEHTLLISPEYIINQQSPKMIEILTRSNEKEFVNSVEVYKQFKDYQLYKYLYPDVVEAFEESYFDSNILDVEKFSHFNSISEECYNLKAEALQQQLQNLEESIAQVQKIMEQLKNAKENEMNLREEMQDAIINKESEHYAYYYTLVNVISIFKNLCTEYPSILKFIDAIDNTSSQQKDVNTERTVYYQLLKSFIQCMKNSISYEDLVLIIFICIIQIEISLGKINNIFIEIFNVVYLSKLNSTRKTFEELTQQFDIVTKILSPIYYWIKEYRDDFNSIIAQNDAFEAIHQQNEKPSIPQILRTDGLEGNLLILILCIYFKKNTRIFDLLIEFMRQVINFDGLFDGCTHKSNNEMFSFIVESQKEENTLILTRNVEECVSIMLFLAKENDSKLNIIVSTENCVPDAINMKILTDLSELQFEQNEDLNLYIIDQDTDNLIYLDYSNLTVVDFSSCFDLDQLRQEELIQMASHPDRLFNAECGVLTQNSSFLQYYQAIYGAMFAMLNYGQASNNYQYDCKMLLRQLVLLLHYYNDSCNEDEEMASLAYQDLALFFEHLKVEKEEILQIYMQFDQQKYQQLVEEEKIPTEQLLQQNFFKNMPEGLLLYVAKRLLNEENVDNNGSGGSANGDKNITTTLNCVLKNSCLTSQYTFLAKEILIVRFFAHISENEQNYLDIVDTEFSGKEFYRNELTSNFFEIIESISNLPEQNRGLQTSISTFVINSSSSSVVKDEERPLRELNFSEMFSARTNESLEFEEEFQTTSGAIIITQYVKSGQKYARWGSKLVGVEIGYSFDQQKFIYKSLVKIGSIQYESLSDFNSLGILIICCE